MIKLQINKTDKLVVINDEVFILENVRSFIIEKISDDVFIKNAFTDRVIAGGHFQDWHVEDLEDSVLTPVESSNALVTSIITIFAA